MSLEREPVVLIVEDEQAVADLYARFLEPTYGVHTAYNGTDTLEKMSDEVDIVLLDRRMPGLSGEEVLEAI
jgi:CheY-like chemotaxis protein